MKKLFDLINKRYKLVILIIGVILSIPFIFISVYSRPCADDFTYSLEVHRVIINGNWNVLDLIATAAKKSHDIYMTWQGTYTSAFIMALQPGVFNEKLYFLGPLLLLLLNYLCQTYFLNALFKKINLKMNSWLVSFILLIIVYEGIPSIVNALYWFNGSWHYIPYFYETLLNLGLLFNYIDSNKTWQLACSCTMSFLISGGNQVTSFTNILVLILFCIICYKKNKKTLLNLLFATIGFAIMYLSPGTTYRQSILNKQTIAETIYYTALRSREWISMNINAVWFFIFGCFILFAFYIKDKVKVETKYNPLIFVIYSLMIMCGTLAVSFYSTGWFGDDRVINAQWLVYTYLVGLNILYVAIWGNNKGYFGTGKFLQGTGIKISLLICILFTFASVGSNGLLTTFELSNGTAKTFAAQFDERIELMNNRETNDELIVVDPLVNCVSLKFKDIKEKEEWRNKAWQDYYGYRMVVSHEN